MTWRSKTISIAPWVILALIICVRVHGQENVFALLKSDLRLADEYYDEKNYSRALQLYWKISENNSDQTLKKKIARCYFFQKEYKKAASIFNEVHTRSDAGLSQMDLYYYAEAQASTGDYKKAIEIYRQFLKLNPGDTTVAQKIWRLSNAHYLYEDSLHYAVRSVSINTEAGEICPRWYKDGIVFLSSRGGVQIVEKLNQSNSPFYKAYFTKIFTDSIRENILSYKAPLLIQGDINATLHAGPMAFFEGGRKMVFVSNGKSGSNRQTQTLQLQFDE